MMSRRPFLPAFALGLLLAASAFGQDHHMRMGNPKDYDSGPPVGGDPTPPQDCEGVAARVTIGPGPSFSPSTVTISAGQPVCWTWSASEDHNVKADNGSFTTGSPASAVTFQRTFTTPGTYGYYCQVHGSLSDGMRGTVIVTSSGDDGGGGSGPGVVGVAATSYTVDESAGALTVTVARTGGSDGAATVKYATAPGTAKPGKDFTPRSGVLKWAKGDGDPKSFEIPIKSDSTPEPDETFQVRLSKATGAKLGDAVATVTIHDGGSGCAVAALASAVTEGSTAACDDSRALCLGNGRFEATVEWSHSIAKMGGQWESKRMALPEAPGTGFFSSPSGEEPQLLVNVLDRCAEGGHYGLDVAALTDLEFTLRVRDTQTGRTQVYFHQAGGAPATLRDLEAFDSCP